MAFETLKKYTSCRFVMAYIGLYGFICVYALRMNMSVGIVCMVNDPTKNDSLNFSLSNETFSSRQNKSIEDSCSDFEAENQETDPFTGELEWDRKTCGIVLSSFFWGYIITQIPGGALSSYFGCKKVHGYGMLISVIATYLVPVAARYSVIAVVFLRVVMGLGTGVSFPANYSLMGRWAPKFERSIFVTINYAGAMLGNIFVFSSSGYLCAYGFDGGWPTIFYVTAIVSTVWLILWVFLVFDGPEKHPRITESEKLYIKNSIGKVSTSSLRETPIKSMLKSSALWGIIIAHMCQNVGQYTMFILLPSYLRDVLHFNVKQNGLFASLPYIGMLLSGLFIGQVADYVRARGAPTGLVRKIIQTIAWSLSAVFIIIASYINCEDRMLGLVFIVIGATAMQLSRGGYACNHIDIAPRYAGILFGITNVAGTIPGIIVPLLSGSFVKTGSRSEWQIMFYLCGVAYIIGIVFVWILFQGEVQDWAKEHSDKISNGETKQVTTKFVENT